ncbi:MAG: amidohydrolase [Planctomycetaceae bacterium]
MLAPSSITDLSEIVHRCDELLAHAWMVRTFIKHGEEIDDYPELMGIVRSVFDISRALETRQSDHVGYVRMLNKKVGKLRKAAEQFAVDALKASTHTNFQQAVKSMNVCVREMQLLSARGQELLATLPPATTTSLEVEDDER